MYREGTSEVGNEKQGYVQNRPTMNLAVMDFMNYGSCRRAQNATPRVPPRGRETQASCTAIDGWEMNRGYYSAPHNFHPSQPVVSSPTTQQSSEYESETAVGRPKVTLSCFLVQFMTTVKTVHIPVPAS